jgi:Meiotically up-regulated gene 113
MTMTKEGVAQRIRQLAAQRGGHISFRAFVSETGIQGRWLRNQEWFTKWNDLLAELGIATRQFDVPPTPRSRIAEAVAELIQRLGRWPTEDDLQRARKKDRSFPSLKVISPLRRSGELAALVVALGSPGTQFGQAAMIAGKYVSIDKERADADIAPNERVKGYVYMLRSGRRYKIGKSSDPSRRYREVRLELPEETHQVHTIPTDDPTGIEKYWLERFSIKRVRNTEFFALDGYDIQAFKRRKYQ